MLVCRPWKEQQQQEMAQVKDREMERLPVVQDGAMAQLCAVQAQQWHLLGVLNCETPSRQ